jgi:ABC-2 type transport system ATP-binding protein
VEDVCDSFTVLSGGRVVWDGSVEQMQAAAPLSAYLLATSDDTRALELANLAGGVRAERADAGGLVVQAPAGAMDEVVLALARADVAVRRLELPASPLESMFRSLTEQQGSADARPQHAGAT